MPTTFVTGASGLVGSAVARQLAARGDDLRLAVRERSPRDNLGGLEDAFVTCDVLDRRAVRRALAGADRVFHVAGSTNLRSRAATLDRINVEGTRIVLEEALKANVERVVHTSSAAVVGTAPKAGATCDEESVLTGAAASLPYVNSKREAEATAMRMLARGLPVVVVNPSSVFGPGDVHNSSTNIVRRFLRRDIPGYVDGTLNIVDLRDVARGHVLADERGVPGERYLLTGRNFTLDRLFADLGRISGVEPPALKMRRDVALAFAEAAERLPGRPITTLEVRAMSLHWSYRATKAKRELGWKAGPHEETLESTIAWWRDREGSALSAPGARQPAVLRAAGFAARRLGRLV